MHLNLRIPIKQNTFFSISASPIKIAAALLIFILLNGFFASATNYTSNGNGDWNVSTNWTPAGIPGAADAVNIKNNAITLSGTASCASLTFQNASSTLALNAGSTLSVNGTFSAGTNLTCDAASTVNFNGTAAQTIPTGTYGNIKISNTAGASFAATAISTSNILGTLSVETGGKLVIGSGVTYTGVPLTVKSGATLSMGATLPTGLTTSFDAASTISFNAAGAQTIPAYTYGIVDLAGSGVKTVSTGTSVKDITFNGGSLTLGSGSTLSISGSLASGGTTSINSASTITFNGTAAQTIPAYNFGSIKISNTSATGASFATSAITTSNIQGTLSVETSGNLVLASSTSYTGVPLTVKSGATLNVGGTLPAGLTISIDAASTVKFSGAAAQVIPAYSYGSLQLSGVGSKTLSGNTSATDVAISGGTLTVGGTQILSVSGSLQASAPLTLTSGSTVVFNGASGNQVIPVYSYTNLQTSGASTKTLGGNLSAKDIAISGGTVTVGSGQTLSVSGSLAASAPLSFNAASIIIFNGTAAQTIPAYTYGNLQASNTGTKTLGGNITANDVTVSGGILTVGSGQILTVTGSLQQSASLNLAANSSVKFSGSQIQTIPVYTYTTLIVDKATSKTLAGNIAVKDITFTGTGSGTLTIGANQTLSVSGSLPASAPLTFDAASTVNFNGTSAQTIPAYTYGSLQFNGAGTKTLGGDVTAGNTLINALVSLSGGSIYIGSNTLTMQTAGSLSEFTNTNYIKLSTGKMVIQSLGSAGRTAEFIFPVGTTTSFTPAYIANIGASNDFSVNVVDGIKDQNNNTVTKNVVTKTWNVNRETSNGAVDVTLKLQWNDSDEAVDPVVPANSFNRNTSTINHFENGVWNQLSTSSLTAAGSTYYVSASGITSFSPFGVADNTNPLPVELLNFKAVNKNGVALLTWQTATEKDNKGFEIQASRDGRNFEAIGFVASKAANSATLQSYEFVSSATNNGTWYFRLKQVDLSGAIAYSETRNLSFNSKAESLQILPNPFRENVSVTLQLNDATEVVVELRDLTGKTVYTAAKKCLPGQNLIPVPESQLQHAGIYFLTVKTPSQTFTNKIIKL